MSLLTLIVPTYQRAGNLDLLLRVLREEVSPLGNEVTVIELRLRVTFGRGVAR
jgi:hypothetical protein